MDTIQVGKGRNKRFVNKVLYLAEAIAKSQKQYPTAAGTYINHAKAAIKASNHFDKKLTGVY